MSDRLTIAIAFATIFSFSGPTGCD